jgi:hypothetical protein
MLEVRGLLWRCNGSESEMSVYISRRRYPNSGSIGAFIVDDSSLHLTLVSKDRRSGTISSTTPFNRSFKDLSSVSAAVTSSVLVASEISIVAMTKVVFEGSTGANFSSSGKALLGPENSFSGKRRIL